MRQPVNTPNHISNASMHTCENQDSAWHSRPIKRRGVRWSGCRTRVVSVEVPPRAAARGAVICTGRSDPRRPQGRPAPVRAPDRVPQGGGACYCTPFFLGLVKRARPPQRARERPVSQSKREGTNGVRERGVSLGKRRARDTPRQASARHARERPPKTYIPLRSLVGPFMA